MNENFFTNISILLIFLGVGIQLIFSTLPDGIFIGGIINTAGIILLFRERFIKERAIKIKQDERSRKIGSYAATYSWMITILALITMFWVNRTGLIQLSVDIVIGLIYIVMAGSLVVYKYYFNKKGDIE